MSDWLTNDPKAAKRLKAVDAAYEAEKAAATSLRLADKVSALRAAKANRNAALKAIGETL